MITEMTLNLCATPWTIVDVALPHSHLATLYPTKGRGTGSGSMGKNLSSFAVAQDVLQKILELPSGSEQAQELVLEEREKGS